MKLESNRRKSNLPRADKLVWILAAVFGILAVASAILIFSMVRDMVGSWTGVGLNPFNFQASSANSETAEPGATPLPVSLDAEHEPWNGTDRVTILLMALIIVTGNRVMVLPDRFMMLVTVDPSPKKRPCSPFRAISGGIRVIRHTG